MAATIQSKTFAKDGRPTLKYKIENGEEICSLALLPSDEGVVIGSIDRSLAIWLRRENGTYWPAVREVLPSPVTCIDMNWETRRLFVGLDNGTICEYRLGEDLNSMEHIRDCLTHMARVFAVKFMVAAEWVISCSKDRNFAWTNSESGHSCGAYQLEGRGTALEYDTPGRLVFVGVHTGCISILRLNGSNCESVNNLRGHAAAVHALSWDSVGSRLFSAGDDCTVIVWDIGGGKGIANELQAHEKEVTSVIWCSQLSSAISVGLDGLAVFWDMRVTRRETPRWQESDLCQMEDCRSPFIWNLKSMWENKTMGGRQHHCRVCGRAVCDPCSNRQATYPVMGYEKAVRMCKECYAKLADTEQRSLASIHDVKHAVTHMCLDGTTLLLLTAGKDKVVKAWDISSLKAKK